MLGELIAKFRAHMDEAAANAAVEKYHTAFSDAATVLDGLTPELDEALLSVPTFVAEEARAEAYGARSLNEFKKEHSWQRPESTIPYKYSDLDRRRIARSAISGPIRRRSTNGWRTGHRNRCGKNSR
ncbi:hypothetical protein [Streptomyces murinus]|uniref:hypothetical protein n=1 Tax=Streptomyces murinus TaxID=33900 RepID=UPI003643B98A